MAPHLRITPSAALSSQTGPPFSLGGSRPSPHTRTLTCAAIQWHVALFGRLPVNGLHLHVKTWINYSFIDPGGVVGWVGLVGWPIVTTVLQLIMGKVSTVGQPTRPTQPSIHPGSWMSSNPCNYMYYAGWRPLNGRLYGSVWLFGNRSKSVAAGSAYGLHSIGCIPALSVTQKAPLQLQLWLVASRYISVICLCICNSTYP